MKLDDYDVLPILYWSYYYSCKKLFFETFTSIIYNTKLQYDDAQLTHIKEYDTFIRERFYDTN